MAVFRRSFMLSRSSEMPVSIVLTFQVPSFRDGLISVFLKVQGVVRVLLFGFWPSLLHPKRHVIRSGNHLTYWGLPIGGWYFSNRIQRPIPSSAGTRGALHYGHMSELDNPHPCCAPIGQLLWIGVTSPISLFE